MLLSALLPACGTEDPQNGHAVPWQSAFDTTASGALSAVWGSSARDVYVVGGDDQRGEVYRFDGSAWSAQDVPQTSLLVWLFGFAADDILAVGVEGAALHFDGAAWRVLDTGVTADLWGVWGASPDDVWIVGADTAAGEPLILHYDGTSFTAATVPDIDRVATQLFKVWGIGDRVFAVGELGLILQLRDGAWEQVFGGPNANDDFVSLWGTSEERIVAVGGRSSARIAVYDGVAWDTLRPSGVPGLNAVFMLDPNRVIVGGINGFIGEFNPSTGAVIEQESGTTFDLHATWGADSDTLFMVGGLFREPWQGVALENTP